MAEKSYNVILEGSIMPGRSRQDVAKRLSLVFKKDAAVTEKLLSGKPRLIRQNIDFATADKYRNVIEKAGAVCRIEQVKEPERSVEPKIPGAAHEKKPAVSLATCPRCGYQATSESDVMLVRGDCPRCGLMTKKEAAEEDLLGPAEEEDDFFDTDESPTDLLVGRKPASIPRRALASIYTFSQFLTIYCILVLLVIVSFTPMNLLPQEVAKRFFVWACTAYPVVLGVFSVLIVSFAVPMLNEGRSWGQKALSIDILYTEEVQFGGLALALAFRNVAICSLSFAPALIIRRLGYKMIVGHAWWGEALVITALGFIAWSFSWLLFLIAGRRRSLLDVASGTVQTETGLLPPKAVMKALFPLFTILVILAALGALSIALEKLGW
jgi:hypothetical protein